MVRRIYTNTTEAGAEDNSCFQYFLIPKMRTGISQHISKNTHTIYPEWSTFTVKQFNTVLASMHIMCMYAHCTYIVTLNFNFFIILQSKNWQ